MFLANIITLFVLASFAAEFCEIGTTKCGHQEGSPSSAIYVCQAKFLMGRKWKLKTKCGNSHCCYHLVRDRPKCIC